MPWDEQVPVAVTKPKADGNQRCAVPEQEPWALQSIMCCVQLTLSSPADSNTGITVPILHKTAKIELTSKGTQGHYLLYEQGIRLLIIFKNHHMEVQLTTPCMAAGVRQEGLHPSLSFLLTTHTLSYSIWSLSDPE